MECPFFDDGVEGVEVTGEAGGGGGCWDVTSENVDAIRDLIPDRRVAKTTFNRISGCGDNAPLLVAKVILLQGWQILFFVKA